MIRLDPIVLFVTLILLGIPAALISGWAYRVFMWAAGLD